MSIILPQGGNASNSDEPLFDDTISLMLISAEQLVMMLSPKLLGDGVMYT